jgi:hypothetical protein
MRRRWQRDKTCFWNDAAGTKKSSHLPGRARLAHRSASRSCCRNPLE